MAKWIVVRAGSDNEEDAEAFGPFTSLDLANRVAEEYGDWVQPAYSYMVVELLTVKEAQSQIRDEKREDAAGAWNR